MVDFSVQSTNLAAPDLKAASFQTQGVVADQSVSNAIGANVLGQVAQQGIDAYKGAQLAEVNTLTQGTIQEYMDRRENPELAKGVLADAVSTDIQSSVFKPQGQQLSSVEQAQRERLSTYQQALAEGVMSPDEFSDRVMANLRETVNKNPGLYPELKAEAARVLELSGITGIIKSDELIRKNKEKQAKDMLDDMQLRARKENIYYDINTGYWDLAEKVGRAENDTRLYDMQVRGKERFAMASSEQARSWVQSRGDEIVRGSLSTASKTILSMIDDQAIDASSYPKFKTQIETQLDNIHQVLIDSLPVNIRQDPVVQDKIKSHADGIASIKNRLSNLVTGEDIKKVLTNEVEILKMTQEKNLRQSYNVAELDLMGNMVRNIPGVIVEGPVRERYTQVITAIAGNNYQAPAIKEIIPKSPKDNVSGTILDSAIKVGITSGDYTGFKRTLDVVNQQTPGVTDPKTRVQFLVNNLSAIAKQQSMKLDSDSIQKVETAVGQVIHDPNFGIGTLPETMKGQRVKMDVLPSGQLMFIGEDSAKFNSTYSTTINVALQAYANAHNQTVEKAAKRFYPQYFGSLISANK